MELIPDRTKVQIFPCRMQGVYCDEYNCRNRAAHFIGRPDSPINKLRKICDHHKQELIESALRHLPAPEPLYSIPFIPLVPQVPEHQVPAQDHNTDSTGNMHTVDDVPPIGGSEALISVPLMADANKFICQHCGKDYFINSAALRKHEGRCSKNTNRGGS